MGTEGQLEPGSKLNQVQYVQRAANPQTSSPSNEAQSKGLIQAEPPKCEWVLIGDESQEEPRKAKYQQELSQLLSTAKL